MICLERRWSHGFEANPRRSTGRNGAPSPGHSKGTRKVLVDFLERALHGVKPTYTWKFGAE